MSSFLKVNDLFLISSSPERFLSKNGEDIISQPIKGTAKEGIVLRRIKKILMNYYQVLKNYLKII